MRLVEIKGIGEKTAEKLAAAGMSTAADLLRFYPRRYIDLTCLSDLSTAEDGETVVVSAEVKEVGKPARIRRGLSVLRAKFDCGSQTLSVVWFNQDYYKNITVGKEFYLVGKFKRFKTGIQISSPKLLPCDVPYQIYPLYKSIKGVSNAVLIAAVEKALKSVSVESYVGSEVMRSFQLLDVGAALAEIHCPKSLDTLNLAKRSLSVEHLSVTVAAHRAIRNQQGKSRKNRYNIDVSDLSVAVESLPFRLTKGQSAALDEILSDLNGSSTMNRLLQGDVGCGKTVVALLAMYAVSSRGYQCAMMAPTDVLAVQHYHTALKLFEPLGVRCVLLTGALGKKQRDEVLFHIETGNAAFVFGTHALFSKDVRFNRLSFIVTDEQQRFGVKERGALENKGEDVDILVMSATPIPRTLSLALYGELGQSVIAEKPLGRQPTVTRLVPQSKVAGMWVYIKEKAEAGEQTFVVCPRIEEDDELFSNSDFSAEAVYKSHKTQFPSGYIALLHGRMKENEKREIMQNFSSGAIKVLVSTTVIEVGVDVPAATTMVIYGAERFGLSQLHQLRGRVGRGKKQSYCFIVGGSKTERLAYFASCDDGFKLAEYDLSARGGGELFGTGQHGSGGLYLDVETIAVAKAAADTLLCDEEKMSEILLHIGENGIESLRFTTLN